MPIERVDVRRVGRGFIVGTSIVEKEGTKDQTWDHKEEIFLEKDKLKEHMKKQIDKL